MPKFSHRALHFIIRKLTAIHDGIDQKRKDEIELAWMSKFKNSDFFDYTLESGIVIRLYKDSVLSRLIHDGFENEELNFLRRYLQKGDTFLDIGANVGLFSLVASNKVGAQGRILAFEPSPKTYGRFKENILLNSITNVEALNIGLSDKEDVLKLNVSENGYDAWNSFVNVKDDKFQVTAEARVRRLDDVIEDNNVKNVDLVKLDVEGWEKYVLYGGENFFKNQSPVVMVEFTETNTFSAGYHVQELFDILESWGYTWYRYKDNSLVPEVKQLHYPYDNLFAIKELDAVLNKIKN